MSQSDQSVKKLNMNPLANSSLVRQRLKSNAGQTIYDILMIEQSKML
jgi:hypothetical protein